VGRGMGEFLMNNLKVQNEIFTKDYRFRKVFNVSGINIRFKGFIINTK